MWNHSLTDDQIKNLVSYCAEKKVTLFEFLFNRMQFKPVYYATKPGEGINFSSFEETVVDNSPIWYHYEPKGTFVAGEIYLMGNHSIDKHQSCEIAWLDYQGCPRHQNRHLEEDRARR